MISHGVSILFSFFANKKKLAERMKMKMSEVVESVTKKELPANQLFITFEIIANDLDSDEEVELPYVKFRFRWRGECGGRDEWIDPLWTLS